MFRSWIILGLFLSKGISVSGTTLTITPNQVHIGGANPTWLNGTCRPPTGTSVFAMTIGRRRISSWTDSVMVQLQIGEEVKMPGGNFGSRLTAQGDIQSGSSSSSSTLRFGLSNPTCDDIRYYTFYCSTNFLPADAGNFEDLKNISYTASPDNFKMIVFPDYSTYDPPTVVTFTCTALIGSDFPTDLSQFWRWQNRSVADNMATNWQDYPYTSNISYSNPIPSGCNYNGRSELRHTVTDQDDYQQFRCYIVNSHLYSGNKTVRTTGPPFPPTDVSVTSDASSMHVTWLRGYNRGLEQSFTVEYSLDKTVWTDGGTVTEVEDLEYYKTVISGLEPSTQYFVRVRAHNPLGYSPFTDTISVTTDVKQAETSTQTDNYGAGLGTGLGIGFGVTIPVIVVLVVVVIVIYRRKTTTGKSQSTPRDQLQTDRTYEDVDPTAPVDRSTYDGLDNTTRTQDYAELKLYENSRI